MECQAEIPTRASLAVGYHCALALSAYLGCTIVIPLSFSLPKGITQCAAAEKPVLIVSSLAGWRGFLLPILQS